MKISVIIPIYNGENTIEECLDTVLKQTFTDFEVVLIDDGSTDMTALKCAKYQERDSRIKYYYQSNTGVAFARNTGIKFSVGEFITFIDADDIVDERYLEILYKRCIEVQADISICDIIVEECGEQKKRFSCDESIMNNTEAIELLLSRENINSGPCAKLFKRNIVEQLEFPKLKTYEDIIFVLNAFESANKIVSTSKVKYHYLSNPNSAMHSIDMLNSIDVLIASSEIIEYLNANKRRFTDKPFYTTVSHVMQYVQIIYSDLEEVKRSPFIVHSYKFMKKNRIGILKNKKFPFKEKCIYLLLSYNLRYCGKLHLKKMCDM